MQFYIPDTTRKAITGDFRALSQKMGYHIAKYNVPQVWMKTQGEGVTVAVLDSTPRWSPVICRDVDGKVHIFTVEEFYDMNSSEPVVTEKQEEIKHVSGWEVWNGHVSTSSGYWSAIKHVLRHRYQGRIVRINALGGVVDVTPNHSIFAANGRLVAASDIRVDSAISLAPIRKIQENSWFLGHKDVAWLFGFWAAEGSAYKVRAKDGYDRHYISITNKNRELLEKCRTLFAEHFNVQSRVVRSSGDVYKLHFQNKEIYEYFVENCTYKGQKRVPSGILNAPKIIKEEFLRGYNFGDGYHKARPRCQWEFLSFTTKSQLLASGLVYCIETVLNQEYNCFIREDKPDIITISLNKPLSEKEAKPRNVVKKVFDICYEGFVYDLETETHSFGCGVGPIRIHNTGCQMDHEDLVGSFATSRNCITASRSRARSSKKSTKTAKASNLDVTDRDGHGTHVCGIITANNNELGCVGVAPESKVIPIKVLGDDGSGSFDAIISGIDQAIALKVDVINMSLGSSSGNAALYAAIRRAYDANIPVVCAAGNRGTAALDFPAQYRETISVGALDPRNMKATFSQMGPNLDFMAPGVDILSTVPTNGYMLMSGTSMASPWLAGIVALLISKHKKNQGKTPIRSVDDVREHIRSMTVDLDSLGRDSKTGFGLVDVTKMREEFVTALSMDERFRVLQDKVCQLEQQLVRLNTV
jgi:subtilisin family serine protease